jgi:hypothetical protein
MQTRKATIAAFRQFNKDIIPALQSGISVFTGSIHGSVGHLVPNFMFKHQHRQNAEMINFVSYGFDSGRRGATGIKGSGMNGARSKGLGQQSLKLVRKLASHETFGLAMNQNLVSSV